MMGIMVKLNARSSMIVCNRNECKKLIPVPVYDIRVDYFKVFVVLAVIILIFAIWLLGFFDVFYDLFSGFCWFFEVPDFC